MERKLCYSLLAVVFFIRDAHLTYYPTVFWTPTNCRFNLNKQNGGEYFIQVKSFSNMIFMCPHISIWAGKSDITPQRSMMHENIVMVDKESYKSCSIKNRTLAKTLLTCDADPMGNSVKYSKEHFVSVQANPNKQCYKMGHHYYFISTSDGSAESLNSTEGGHCKTHNMKLHIYVCNENDTCEFEMPECPKEEQQQNNQSSPTDSPTNCTNDSGSISAQTGVKEWFSDNRHPVLYAVMGLVILILLTIILCLFHDNRKYRKSGATVVKKNKKKSSIDKELI